MALLKKKPAVKKKTAKKRPVQKRGSAKESFLSYAYVGAMAVGGAAKKVFGTRRKRIVAASLLAVDKGVIPPTRNCDSVADECPINVVRNSAQPIKNTTFLKVSHANTGRSFALVLKK